MIENAEVKNKIEEQLQNLIAVYGPEKVKHFASQLLEAKKKDLSSEYTSLITLNAIQQTLDQLDICSHDVVEKSGAQKDVFQKKSPLLKRKFELETAVKLTEADAFMLIDSSGKFVVVNGQQIPLSNDVMRDAYRRQASKEQRKELATVNGDLASIDVDMQQAKDALYGAKDALESAKAKAGLQAALLLFLANR